MIGALFVDPKAIDEVSDILTGRDFYDDQLGEIFDVFVLLAETKQHADTNLVLSRLKKYGIRETTTDDTRIARVINQAVSRHGCRYYADEILRLSNHRKLIHLTQSAMGKLIQKGVEPTEVGRWLAGSVEDIEARGAIKFSRLGRSAAKAVEKLIQRRAEPQDRRASGCQTGIAGLDTVTGGMCGGELTVLAARPGQGKTALAMQFLNNAAIEGKRSLFVSLEMTDEELATRVLCAVAGVNNKRIRSGTTSDEEVSILQNACRIIDEREVEIYDPPKATVRQIRAAAKMASIRRPIDLLCVDYLNLIVPENRRIDRREQIAEMTGALKALAKEMKIPVLLLCQLNREADKSDTPKLNHLKESGAIEQDADVILAIHHEIEERQGHTPKPMAIISVLKNRHGDVGSIRCNWSPEATRFSEAESTDDLIPM